MKYVSLSEVGGHMAVRLDRVFFIGTSVGITLDVGLVAVVVLSVVAFAVVAEVHIEHLRR